MENKDTILTKMYDFILYIVPILTLYPKTHKYLIADKIETQLLNTLDRLVEAYYQAPAKKKEILYNVNIELEKVRFLVRLSHDLRLLSPNQYKQISEKTNEIGKMIGGWQKSLK